MVKQTVVRTNRNTIRLFFALVLAAGLAGATIAASLWNVDVASLPVPGINPDSDWVDTISLFAEQAIQFFLGWTQNPPA